MIGQPGRLLSPEASFRLAIADNADRDVLIEAIVTHLRRAAQPRNPKRWASGTPRDWYRCTPLRRR